MAVNYTQLAAEITTDPKGLGYAGQSPAAQAALINAVTGPGAGTVARISVPITDPAMVSLLSYALTQIHTLTSATLQSFYLTLVNTIVGVGAVSPQNTYTQSVLALAIADGVITDAIAAPVQSETGSRAEVLFGDAATVGWEDIVTALGG